MESIIKEKTSCEENARGEKLIDLIKKNFSEEDLIPGWESKIVNLI